MNQTLLTDIRSPIFSGLRQVAQAINAGLTRIKRARGFLEAATLSENWVREMGNRDLTLEAHNTTPIEDTRLTLDQAKIRVEQLIEQAVQS